MAIQGGLSKRAASGLLHQAHDLAEHAGVAQAAAAGRISVNQARAIHTVLAGLDGLDGAQQAKAEELVLGMAASTDTDRLAKAAPQVLAQVAPRQAARPPPAAAGGVPGFHQTNRPLRRLSWTLRSGGGLGLE